MTSNPEQIVQQVQHDFQSLVAYVTGPDARAQTAYTVELTLFRRLLALGAALLRLFFDTRAAGRPAGPVLAPDGTPLRYPEQRLTTYDSGFGKVCFGRHYFIAPGQVGICPLDAELSLPARGYSDLLCEWVADGTTEASYRESQRVIERILGVSLSVQALETSVAEAAGEVTAFYDQPTAPPAPRRWRRNGTPPWRAQRSPCANWWNGAPCGRGPRSSTGWRSPMAPRPWTSR